MAGISKERWWTLTLAEQLGNIGSEVGRARKWQGKDNDSFWGAVGRALELLDLTRADTADGKIARQKLIGREKFSLMLCLAAMNIIVFFQT